MLFGRLGAFLLVTGGSFANFSLMNTGGTCEGVAEAVKYRFGRIYVSSRLWGGDACCVMGL